MATQSLLTANIRRTAYEVKRYRTWMRIVPIGIIIAILILVIGYVVSALYMRFGAFTVRVNKFDNLDYALTLSESPDFNNFTSRLTIDIDEEITCISTSSLPDAKVLDNINGIHNGENYVAYTFYCMNAGKVAVDYNYELYIANETLGMEKAVRVRLYVNGDYVDYAYPRTDGVEGPEPNTVAFKSGKTVTSDTISGFAPGDVTKYTVVIWLEGDDPECVDPIIGGRFKVDMIMEVVSAAQLPDETGASGK